MEEGGAALPWGAANEQEVPVEADLPSTMGLQLGTRVEVLWALQAVPDDGEAEDAVTTKVNCKLGSDRGVSSSSFPCLAWCPQLCGHASVRIGAGGCH